ncbi:hypothetical protein G7054_g10157 [Neopestalotiopsis clavispora]|nr:hypothetical protein G7054_g10157 [Neopestalotiopsis clavispora]
MPANQSFQVANLTIEKPSIGHNGYVSHGHRIETLPKGWNGFNSRALSEDLIAEHDLGIKVRDGCTLYCDVYRPASATGKVPAIVCWSPFGKKHNGIGMMKKRPRTLRGPRPGRVLPRGFAIVNVDARGAGHSDGSIVIMGQQEGEDGHDVIEALAKMDWCNGNVGLAGNSHLGIVQWFIAATRPPSLKAIAPWEACGDLYREQFVRGGAWDNGLFDLITKQVIRGHNGCEDFREMYRRCQTMNPYWADKRANIKNISIPTYVVASYSTFVHTMGSIRGWLEVQTEDKWLRWDPYQEWYDLWVVKESIDELAQFFDFYLNGKTNNGWDKTPKVRMSSLRFGDQEPIYPIMADNFPLPETEYREMFFSGEGVLTGSPPPAETRLSYNSEAVQGQGVDFVGFKHTFDSKTRLMGLPKAVVYMSCDDLNDMVVYVLIRKLDRDGNVMMNLNIPWKAAPYSKMSEIPSEEMSNLILYFGPLGVLRASHREIDPSMSIHEQYPFHTHSNVQKVPPGQIVELEIGLWAMGIDFEEGESLRVQISGQYPLIPEYKQARPAPAESSNKGHHKVHVGGNYPSRIILPFVDI